MKTHLKSNCCGEDGKCHQEFISSPKSLACVSLCMYFEWRGDDAHTWKGVLRGCAHEVNEKCMHERALIEAKLETL